MERPIFALKAGYLQSKEECIQFIRRLEEYCNSLEETITCLKGFNSEQEQRIITLLKSNEALRKRDNILRALENGGVDNWEWIGEALDVLDDNGEFKPW
jgi:hypothetical protein